MTHTLFPSIDALLAPETLSELVGQRVEAVAASPLEAEYAKSGSRLLRVETNGGRGPAFILKRISTAWDWLMRATDDHGCRSVTLWTSGLFDRMPPQIEHATVAGARDGDGWALLMRDVGASLLPYAPLSLADLTALVEALAALHAAFFEAPDLCAADAGLCSVAHAYAMFSRHTSRREAEGTDDIPKSIERGWTLFEAVVAPDVADVVLALVEDPSPLVQALARYPQTLVHGDARHANLGLLRGEPTRVVMLDWALAAAAPVGVELGRFIGTNTALLPLSKEATVEMYRQRLASRLGPRFGDDWWRGQLALGLLGGFVQDGWAIALKSTGWRVPAAQRPHWQADLRWWEDRVREGSAWL